MSPTPSNFMIGATLAKRLIRGGKAPPMCEMRKVMFGHRLTVPDKNRLMTARAVSKKNSNIGLGNCGRGVAAVPDDKQGVVGWINTTAFLRFSSSKIGSKSLCPR